MPDFNKITPLLDGMIVEKELSVHNGRACYLLSRQESKEQFVLKHMSVPATDSQIRALILSGAYANEAAVHEYYGMVIEDMKQELRLGQKLAESGCYAGALDFQIEPKQEGVGYDVYILHPLHVALNELLSHSAMTHLRAVNLGIDLCDALITCREAGYLFQNVKPENIFLMPNGRFLLGDLGLVALQDLKYASVPEEYIGAYSAPELSDIMASPNLTNDLYSLGMVLYRIYNGNHGPFEDENTPEAMADKLRLTGKPLPTPLYADYELASIILKACSFRIEDRFLTPELFKQALMQYMQRNEISDELIVPPIVTAPEPIDLSEEEPEDEPVRMVDPDSLDETFRQSFAPDLSGAGTEEDMEPDEDVSAVITDALDMVIPIAPKKPEPAPETKEISEEERPVEVAPEERVQEESAAVEEPVQEAPVQKEPVQEEPVQEAPPTETAKMPQGNLKMKRKKRKKDARAEESAPVPAYIPPAEAEQMDIDELIASVNEAVGNVEAQSGKKAEAQPAKPEEKKPAENAEKKASEDGQTSESLSMHVSHVDDAYTYDDSKGFKEDDATNEKRSRKWLKSCLIVFLLAAIFGLVYYFMTTYFVTVTELKVIDYNTSELTVEVITPDTQEMFVVTCTDNYGNAYPRSRNGATYTFTGLRENTPYTVTVSAADGHRLSSGSAYTTSIVTESTTKITEFSARRGAQDGEVLISFAHEGTAPTQWLLLYTDESGRQFGPFPFEGNSYTVTGLQLNTNYTFTLEAEEGIYLSGERSVEYGLLPIVTADALHITAASNNSVSIAWLPGENPPEEWTVSCIADGFSTTETTSDLSYTFTNLPGFTREYSFSVSAPGMDTPETVTLPANPIIVENTRVSKSADDGSVTIRWDTPAGTPNGGWHLSYCPVGSFHVPYVVRSDSEAMQGNSVTLTDLIPNTEYEVTLHLTAEDSTAQLYGLVSGTFTTAEAAPFLGYELTPAAPYLDNNDNASLWIAPDMEEWTWKDLASMRKTFTPEEEIVVCLEAESLIASEDTVKLLYVIRSEDGQVVNDTSEEMTWDALWFDRRHTNVIPRPIKEGETSATPGSYVLEIYINGQLLLQKSFTIE